MPTGSRHAGKIRRRGNAVGIETRNDILRIGIKSAIEYDLAEDLGRCVDFRMPAEDEVPLH
jgi:hypothetical protein